MTYFSINDPEEAIPIRDAIGKHCQFCVGANLDDEIKDDEIILEKNKTITILNCTPNEDKKAKAKKEKPLPGKAKKVLYWICGIENMRLEEENVPSAPQIIDVSIDQDPFWATFCDLNAIIAIALSCFCFAFFNKYNS